MSLWRRLVFGYVHRPHAQAVQVNESMRRLNAKAADDVRVAAAFHTATFKRVRDAGERQVTEMSETQQVIAGLLESLDTHWKQ